jgi:ubiquinone/menaquinone biosynthesis C-methylase UbiE
METEIKAYKGVGMNGWIAKWYDTISRKDLNQYAALADRVSADLSEGSNTLDLAPGPGYFAIELAKRGRYSVTGLDISKTFVRIARRNAAAEGATVDFRQGNAADMPFPEGVFDRVVCRAAFKNFAEPARALQEMFRVLKTGGKALIIDLRKDVSRESINGYVNGLGMRAVNSALTKWTFRWMLIKRAYTKDQFISFISQTKFRQHEIQETPVGFEIWLTK